jgi:hypothetical protein
LGDEAKIMRPPDDVTEIRIGPERLGGILGVPENARQAAQDLAANGDGLFERLETVCVPRPLFVTEVTRFRG